MTCMPASKIYSTSKRKKTYRVSSRLARKEQKSVTRQTFFLIVLAIGLLLTFIFIVLPGAVRLFFQFIDSGPGLQLGDDIPPQNPILAAPVDATFSAAIKLTGYGEPESEVVFVLDGVEEDKVRVDEEGNFSYDLYLSSGENKLVVYGVDSAGNESLQTSTYTIVMDNQPPVIDLEMPKDGETITRKKNQQYTVRGFTEAGGKLYLNDRLVYVKPDGEFSSTYGLSEGENKLLFKAVDRAGNITEKEVTVTFKY